MICKSFSSLLSTAGTLDRKATVLASDGMMIGGSSGCWFDDDDDEEEEEEEEELLMLVTVFCGTSIYIVVAAVRARDHISAGSSTHKWL